MDVQQEIEEITEMVAERYPAHAGEYDVHFVRSHRLRKEINSRVNQYVAAQQEEKLFLPSSGGKRGDTMETQDMWIWPGMELVAYSQEYNEKYPVNGAVYVVEGWTDGTVTVRLHKDYRTKVHVEVALDPDEAPDARPARTYDGDSDSDEEIPQPPAKKARKNDGRTEEERANIEAMKQAAKEMNEGLYVLTHEQASEYLRMQHALVYASIQGRTMRDKHVAILDWHRQGWSIRTLIVAMSRATHGKFVHILHADEERDLLDLYRKRVQDLHV
jgi:hypothetical protein